jgi:hypothetical protein
MTTKHETALLGAYVLDVLDEQEATRVKKHLASCKPCQLEVDDLRGVLTALGEVPPEALIDGPPDDGDLLLQRTLRQARSERGQHEWRRRATLIGAAAAVGAVVLGGGTLIGRSTAPRPGAQPAPVTPAAPTPTATPPAPRFGSATDPVTGARLTVAIRPAAGWVRVNVTASGIKAGQRCRLLVIGRDGSRTEAGSWLVSEAAAASGTSLEGFALVAPADVAAVTVENFAGTKLVSAPV